MNGFILVDKPVGPSSFSAVQSVRRALGIGGRRGTRAGHAGTLDPFASGLLLVLVGRATRLMPFVVGHDKRYLVDVRFGASSDTDDREGTLLPSSAARPGEDAVRAAIPALAASLVQVPPAVSAIHIDGERAYRRVRRGEEVVVPPRSIRFDRIDVVDWRPAAAGEAGPLVRLDVRCATGTYMRALARDLGEAVGCSAHCEELRRLEVGEWQLEAAPDPSDVEPFHLRDPLELVAELPRVQLDEVGVADVAAGRRLSIGDLDPSIGTVALVAPDQTLAAIGEPTSDGTLLQPRTVLVDPPAVGVRGSSA